MGVSARHEVTNAARNARKRDHHALPACVHRGGHSGLQLAGIDRQGETEERPALHLHRDRVRIDHYALRCPINLEGESHRRLLTESLTAEGCARRQLVV